MSRRCYSPQPRKAKNVDTQPAQQQDTGPDLVITVSDKDHDMARIVSICNGLIACQPILSDVCQEAGCHRYATIRLSVYRMDRYTGTFWQRYCHRHYEAVVQQLLGSTKRRRYNLHHGFSDYMIEKYNKEASSLYLRAGCCLPKTS